MRALGYREIAASTRRAWFPGCRIRQWNSDAARHDCADDAVGIVTSRNNVNSGGGAGEFEYSEGCCRGDTIDGLVLDMQKLVNDPQVKFEVQTDAHPGLAAPPSSLENDFYARISRRWRRRSLAGRGCCPISHCVGDMDSAQLRLRTTCSRMGFMAVSADERKDLQRMHGNDERIPVMASFGQKGIDVESEDCGGVCGGRDRAENGN